LEDSNKTIFPVFYVFFSPREFGQNKGKLGAYVFDARIKRWTRSQRGFRI